MSDAERAACERSFPEAFRARVALAAGAPALSGARGVTTYEELERRSNRIAAGVRNEAAAQGPVALLLGETVEFVSALLGVFKAGRIALPLDPHAPDGVRAAMLTASRAELLIGAEGHGLPIPLVVRGLSDYERESEAPLELSCDAGTGALLLYTSGSTGEPQAWCRTHRALVYQALLRAPLTGMRSGTRAGLLLSPAFTGAYLVLLTSLLAGANLFRYDAGELGLARLATWLDENAVEATTLVPSMIDPLLAGAPEAGLAALRCVTLGGEKASRGRVEALRRLLPPGARLVHGYASTEAGTSCVEVIDAPIDVDDSPLPVGWALPGMDVRLVDAAGAPTLRGEIVLRSRYLSQRWAPDADPLGGEPREETLLTGDYGQTNRFAGTLRGGLRGRGSLSRLASSAGAWTLFALCCVGAAPARPAPSVQTVVLKAIARLQGRGVLDAAAAAADRDAVDRAVRLIDGLPAPRGAPVASALGQVAALAARLTAPRALALFGQLTANDDWFARHGPPASGTDITDAEGVVYRYFPGAAFEFHPLANFAALNGDATSKNVAATEQLAAALVARGVPQAGGGVAWEYYFGWEGGTPPWLSGFAQAVAAQAFARAALLVPSEQSSLLAEADAAYRTIPGRLDQQLRVGPWIRLYGFNHDVVLNAQLQTAISLASYGANSGNTQAAALATRMRDAAAQALPRFDTGFWTLYQLPDDPSPLSYQEYVVQLLGTLAKTDPRFATDATRFASYQTAPPLFKLADAGPGKVEFWVSKPATVRVTALGQAQLLAVTSGWHVVGWDPGHAGVFPVHLEATDWAGNSASAEALPIVRVVAPPKPPAPAKRPSRTRPATLAARPLARASTPSTPLVVGAGLDQAGQAALAASDGFDAVRMAIAWPAGASTPTAAAIAALDRLPAGTDLALELEASPLPLDPTGRAALAAYAAAVASQVPALHDLVLAPAPTTATAASYETALAAVYDAVKQLAPSVGVDGVLAGDAAPAATLAALASAYRSSGRTAPLMDELAFVAAGSGAAGSWTLADLGQLTAALASGFSGTSQQGGSLPLIVDAVGYSSTIPAAEAALYDAPSSTGTTSEASQAAAYASAIAAAGCAPSVVTLLLDELVDSQAPGGQAGLYYPNGGAKTSLAPVLAAVRAAEGSGRDCNPTGASGVTAATPTTTTSTSTTSAGTTTRPATTTPTATTPATAAPTQTPTTPTTPTTTTSPAAATPTTTPTPASTAALLPLLAPASLVFPSALSTRSVPGVHVGCTRACLYLVTLQRSFDGAPVLADRGALTGGTSTTVGLPRDPIAPGAYRYTVWLVPQDDPDTVTITRSPALTAG